MTTPVRIFAHGELVVAQVSAGSSRYSTDSLFMLQRYIGKQKLDVDTLTAVSSDAANAPAGTTMLRMEAAPGKIIAYELNQKNQHNPRTADASSPTFEGRQSFAFGEGWTVSLLDVTGA